LKHSIWGNDRNRFKDWEKGDYLLLIIDKSISALAKTTDNLFKSNDEIWEDSIAPYRIPVEFIHILKKENRPSLSGKSSDALLSAYGSKKWGWAIINQTVVPESAAEVIYTEIKAYPNNLREMTEQLDVLLKEEKIRS